MLPVRLLPLLAGDQAEPIVSKGYSFVFFRLHCCATVDQHIFGSVCWGVVPFDGRNSFVQKGIY